MLSKLKADLNDSRITSLIDSKYIFRYDKPEEINCDTWIRYFTLLDKDDLFAGNVSFRSYTDIQIDIFTKGNYTGLATAVYYTLTDKGYHYLEGNDSEETLEDKSKLYHKALRFRKYIYK